VNLAVAAIDYPELPLVARDILHGRFDLPILLVSYRLHSHELANAAVAWLTGIDTIPVFHWGATAVGSPPSGINGTKQTGLAPHPANGSYSGRRRSAFRLPFFAYVTIRGNP
jgi:hypothetical protein